MNKHYSFLFAGLLSVSRLVAQNTFPANGNVGIGTLNPQAPLSVKGPSIWGTFKILPSSNDAETGISFSSNTAETDYSKMWFMGVGGWNTGQSFVIGSSLYTGPSIAFPTNGNVGIGTTSPGYKLEVNGAIGMQRFGSISSQRSPNNSYTNLFLGGAIKDNGDGTYTVLSDGGSNYFGAIKMDNTGANVGAINFYSGSSTGNNDYALTNSDLSNYLRMSIVGGNVGIGTTDTHGFKLAVNGNIRAKEIKVEAGPWPDYVFNKKYRLPSLTETEAYIEKNHHLPEIPSAAQIEREGLNLGETSARQLKKIEELTLYLIEKDKQLNRQNQRIKAQALRLKNLETVVKRLADIR